MKRTLAAAAFALLIATAPAHSATITDDVSFSASNFGWSLGGGSPFPTAPYSQLTGAFTVTFDPLAAAINDSAISLNSLNVLGASLSGFDYTPPSFSLQTCTIRSPCDSPLSFQSGSLTAYGKVGADELILTIANINTSPIFSAAYFNGPPITKLWVNTTGTITVSDPSAVPLPPALPLFAMGLASLGAIGWRRRRLIAPRPGRRTLTVDHIPQIGADRPGGCDYADKGIKAPKHQPAKTRAPETCFQRRRDHARPAPTRRQGFRAARSRTHNLSAPAAEG